MSVKAKKTTKRQKHRNNARKGASYSLRERKAVEQQVRLVYCWRYVDHALAEAGQPIPADHHGYNLLTPAKPETVDAAYQLAAGLPRHWQAIVVAYLRRGAEESRSWAWVTSTKPIIAADDGITPLLAQANDAAMEGVEDDEECYARATIMAPWDSARPIRPDRLASRLQGRLGLTRDDILGLEEWEEPAGVTVETENLDFEVAKALQNSKEKERISTPRVTSSSHDVLLAKD